MVVDMTYEIVSLVTDSWEQIRRIKNYEETLGNELFATMFQNEPECKTLFGFDESLDPKLEELQKIDRFVNHSRYFVRMLDKVLGLLGPDSDMITDILYELGKRHGRFGVKVEFYPSMGIALIDSLGKILGERFTKEIKGAWIEVYQALTYDMIKAQASYRVR